MIARALAVEMDGMFKKGKPFDTDRLRRNLAALPRRPTR
jgi:cytochrome c556